MFPAAHDVVNRRQGEPAEARAVERLIRVDDIKQMMGDCGLLLLSRLGRADVEMAVNLAGVGTNDLGPVAGGEFDGEGGFSRRRRAGDNDELWLSHKR